MAPKVIDIIYNLVRKRLAVFNTKASGSGITRIPTDRQIKKSMEDVFQTLKDGGYNVVSAEKAIQNEDDLARILTKIQQDKIAEATAKQKASEGLERILDKMDRGIPLNPSDQISLQGSGFKTTLDAFKGFEPKVIQGGKPKIIQPKNAKKDIIDANENLAGGANYAKGDTKYNADVLADEVARSRGLDPDELPVRDKMKLYGEAYDYLTEFNRLNKPKKPKKAKGGIVSAVKKLQKKFGKDIIQKGKAPKKSRKKELQDLFREFNRKNKAEGGISDLNIPMTREPDNVEEDKNFEDFFLRKPAPATPKSTLEDIMLPLKSEENLSGTFGVLSENADVSREIEKKIIEKENEYMKRTGKVPPEFFGDKLRIQLQEEFLRKNKAGGGLAYMLGEPREEMAAGGMALRRLLQFLNKQSGKTGSQALKEMKLPDQVKFFAEKQGFNPDQARIEYLEQVLDALKADRKLIKSLEPSSSKDAMEEVADSLFKTEFVDKTQSGRFRGLSSEAIDSSIMELETILKNLKTKGQGRKLNADGGRIGFADGGMSRRTFLKIMAALAAFPVVGKLAKTTKVAKGVKPIVTPTAEMPAHFPKLVEKILREGQVVKKDFVKKTGDVTTYKHPDRPDIELTIEGDGKRIQLDFDTDQGMKGGYEFKQGDIIDEPTSKMRGKRGPDEFVEGEVKYRGDTEGNYYKDFEEGIDTGTENLDAFAGIGKQKTSKSKVILNDEGEAVVRIDEDLAEGGLAGLLGE